MNTPICDFAARYANAGGVRMHMPGHKGTGPLGCEAHDLTEIAGADSLYEACGIIAESEANAARLFGAARTLYSTEGSSQCIRAMLCLAAQNAPAGSRPLIFAARNVHKAFILAAALLDLDVEWLWPETDGRSLCSCPVCADTLAAALAAAPRTPAAVYLTSPDYLGGMQDIAALSAVCRSADVPLLVDNAHGAYLRFLTPSLHPLDLGADLCCDSAHKTLPVLTGGAYLHVGKSAPSAFADGACEALALFGSTSPSYLILQSLDAANAALAGVLPSQLASCAARCTALKNALTAYGWRFAGSEPMKLTFNTGACGCDGRVLAEKLRMQGVECEYADRDFLVCMPSPASRETDFIRLTGALGNAPAAPPFAPLPQLRQLPRALTIRQAVLGPHIHVPLAQAVGRILASPTVSCPPAVPIAVSGEVLDMQSLALFAACGITAVDVAVLR